MTTLAIHSDARSLAKPQPLRISEARVPIAIRQAVASDVHFIDGLQRAHTKMVGFMPTAQLENNIKGGHVLIAEEAPSSEFGVPSETTRPQLATRNLVLGTPQPVGYCIYRDRYFKRDDCGVIYQLNVTPGSQRQFIGAALVRGAFERSAYGCKLFCCWCAQDIAANHFWESIGFVPLAFRAGSRGQAQGGRRKEGRVHIFWQKRIREDDHETPWWFPSETTGGSLRENRLVLPIPPGTHWSDAKPMVLPGAGNPGAGAGLPGGGTALGAASDASDSETQATPKRKPKAKAAKSKPRRGLWFAAAEVKPPPEAPEAKSKRPKRPRMPKQKNDPKFIAAARELRDRYLEEVNSPGSRMLPAANGKYDVSRQLEAAPSTLNHARLLDAA
jgi:hypothetical protein